MNKNPKVNVVPGWIKGGGGGGLDDAIIASDREQNVWYDEWIGDDSCKDCCRTKSQTTAAGQNWQRLRRRRRRRRGRRSRRRRRRLTNN